MGFCDNSNSLINYTKLTSVDFVNSSDMQGEKRGPVQANLCQKLLFLHQLTHNMTTDFSLNHKFNT